MRAAVYTGDSHVSVEQVPTPSIGPGELLIRVESCGICHTDLKKIEYNLLAPPRIFGHETAGVVAAAGVGVVVLLPAIVSSCSITFPVANVFTAVTSCTRSARSTRRSVSPPGYEPAGGGFSQYVRVMDWIVQRGVEKIPDGVSFDRACFVEPVNTCVKAVVQLGPASRRRRRDPGPGPHRSAVHRAGEALRRNHGGYRHHALSPRTGHYVLAPPPRWTRATPSCRERIMDMTGGRGADSVIVAASAPRIVEQAVKYSRPGSRILLFAQTSRPGAHRALGRRHLRGRTKYFWILQCLRGSTEAISGLGFQWSLCRWRI